MGYKGYRIHRGDLPGKPDIAFIGRKAAIFVHGCFWHAHNCRAGMRRPKTNISYWLPKIQRNKESDFEHLSSLKTKGWRTLVIWECELKQPEAIRTKLSNFLS
jgi:DNA mismatch endonuclease (patch repair protein)